MRKNKKIYLFLVLIALIGFCLVFPILKALHSIMKETRHLSAVSWLQAANASNNGQYSKKSKSIKLNLNLQDTQVFGRYTVKTYREKVSSGAYYEILIDGLRRYAEWDEQKFTIGCDNSGSNPLIAIGKDVTGDGKPNLVLQNWNGSAGGGGYYVIFQIDEDFRKIAVIDAIGDGNFCDLDGDNVPEFITYDESFRWWNGCCSADSPYPKVILKYNNKGYHIAVKQMHKPRPDTAIFLKLADSLRNDGRWHIGTASSVISFEEKNDRISIECDLAKAALDLIYSGHLELGWELFDKSWPEEVPEKKKVEGFT